MSTMLSGVLEYFEDMEQKMFEPFRKKNRLRRIFIKFFKYRLWLELSCGI